MTMSLALTLLLFAISTAITRSYNLTQGEANHIAEIVDSLRDFILSEDKLAQTSH
jgi:hypothetical protein